MSEISEWNSIFGKTNLHCEHKIKHSVIDREDKDLHTK